jgi:hypothetical protein
VILPDAATIRALAQDRAAAQRRGWQCHHLLPRALSRHRQIAAWLADIQDVGPQLATRRANILWLPATEAMAATTGMALHRGPHPAYNAIIAARLERIRVATAATPQAAAEARIRIARLQRALTATLSGQAPTALWLNRHDPMRMFADYDSLDSAIITLLTDQPR